MITVYQHFPALNVHKKDFFISSLSNKKLQQKLMQVFRNVNCKTFTFEEIGTPTIPGCAVIFELGIADIKSFNYIDDEEEKRLLAALKKETFRVMDFFCSIRYYTDYMAKKKPLKFDYYMIRLVFPEEKTLELQTYHERGPRYVPPRALVAFLIERINEASGRTILKEIESP